MVLWILERDLAISFLELRTGSGPASTSPPCRRGIRALNAGGAALPESPGWRRSPSDLGLWPQALPGDPRGFMWCAKGETSCRSMALRGRLHKARLTCRLDSLDWSHVHQAVFTAAAFCVFCMRLHFPKIAYAQAHPRIVSSCAKWGPQLGGHKL